MFMLCLLLMSMFYFVSLSVYGSFQYKSTFFSCECPFLRCTQGPLASSMVDQFTKGQLPSDIWVLTELGLPSNQKKSARKHVQETTEISWNARKSELVESVKLQYYYPNDCKWGTFVCHKSYCYINSYPSDDSWTRWHISCTSWDIYWPFWMVSWAIFDGNIDILAQISSYIFLISGILLSV